MTTYRSSAEILSSLRYSNPSSFPANPAACDIVRLDGEEGEIVAEIAIKGMPNYESAQYEPTGEVQKLYPISETQEGGPPTTRVVVRRRK